MPQNTLPDWERVLSSAARLQNLLPDAVLVGGTASALYAEHRISIDADHVLTDLKSRFDAILADLESVAGWKIARVNRPVLIVGSLDGIETGRSSALERAHTNGVCFVHSIEILSTAVARMSRLLDRSFRSAPGLATRRIAVSVRAHACYEVAEGLSGNPVIP